jgi:NADH-quinone oxidoreductase subunit H
MTMLLDLVWLAITMFLNIAIIMGVAPLLIIAERRVSAWIQGRKGPNRVGPQGTMQPLADIVKLMFKEEIVPESADRVLFAVAPLLVFVPPALGFCVIPFGNALPNWFTDDPNDVFLLQVANLPIGMLFLMSVLSVGVYGITLGGWASNNKYALLGSLRASAQLISYELSLGLGILLVVMMSESVDPQAIVWNQVHHGWNLFGGGNPLAIPSGIIGFTLFFICALAENNRLPFDMAECEAELVGGYHTEYSSMKFAMFLLGEYVAMILMSGLMITLFLGGWDIPFVHWEETPGIIGAILSFSSFMVKLLTLLFTYLWIRWTLPRFRYDQLMGLGWKAFLPISLVNIVVMALVGMLYKGVAS